MDNKQGYLPNLSLPTVVWDQAIQAAHPLLFQVMASGNNQDFITPIFMQIQCSSWYAQRSFYCDVDLIQQINNGVQRLDSRITAAVGSQIYDHMEGSIKELRRLRSMLEEAKHGQHITSTMVEDYIVEFLRLEDELTR